MPSINEAVPLSFVAITVVLIFVLVGIGIAAVQHAKKVKESE
ncbi:MAG: hypothetical protein U9N52_00485 [Campylobacterota bacterium]|nr:hypothetical protein [Campylobacterota bacterium]